MSSSPGSSMLRELVGSEMNSVVFVMDYIQLAFSPVVAGPPEPGVLRPPMAGVSARLSAYTLPWVDYDGREHRPGQPGYRDALVDLIGHRLREANEVDGRIRFEFVGGHVVTISLDNDDLTGGPEAAELRIDDDQNSWMVWRPGDNST